jgi:hypothetical protein
MAEQKRFFGGWQPVTTMMTEKDFVDNSLGKKHRADPYFYAFGWGGEQSPGYMKAFQDAVEYQKQSIEPRSKENTSSP